MAREGKKLELYEILAAKRAKGKSPLALDAKSAQQANSLPAEPDVPPPGQGGMIVDDSISPEIAREWPAADAAPTPPQTQYRSETRVRKAEQYAPPPPEPPPEPPRPRSPREVVFALDTAFIFFTVMLALVGSSYFLGYKRGQEERPAGLVGLSDIELSDPAHLGLRHLGPAPRATIRPAEQDYTLLLRTEPATNDLPERLEMELAEAVARGRQAMGAEVQGFIFRTGGNAPHYALTVGLGRTANDAELHRLLQTYNKMEGLTLSREQRPYISCRIASVKDLGTPVY